MITLLSLRKKLSSNFHDFIMNLNHAKRNHFKNTLLSFTQNASNIAKGGVPLPRVWQYYVHDMPIPVSVHVIVQRHAVLFVWAY